MSTADTRTTVRDNADRRLGPTDPSDHIVAVTKSDATDFTDGPCRAVNADADGAVNIVLPDDTVISNYQMHKGYNPISIKRVNTGGDAITMWALY